MKSEFKQRNKNDKNLKQKIWIERIKENKEVFVVAGMVIFLSIIVYLSEVLDIPHYFFGFPRTTVNRGEALFLIILIILIGSTAIIIIKRIIGERRKYLDILRESEEKYHTLFDNMPGAYYRADIEGNILLINPHGAKLLGYNSPQEIIGKNLAKDLYYIPEDRKVFLEELKKRKGNIKDYEVTLKR
ncbi:MAG: PAS domain-containing protein, partial [Atribacterota bacterium]